MQIKKWKEVKPKEKGIMLFTVLLVLLIIGVFFYQSFAIFKANTNQDMIEGNVEDMGDLEFAFYIDGELSPTAPKKGSEYSFDSSSSKCIDVKTNKQVNTNISWDNEKWGPTLSNVDTTKTKCFLNFKKIYKEEILNEAIPDLMNGRLVPVKISETEKPSDIDDATGGKVTKADITSTDNPWYSYKDKKWANAVILREGATDTYQPGEEIYQSDIESYFVWIPRYRYKLKNTEEEFNKYMGLTILGQKKNVEEFYSSIVGENQATSSIYNIQFESKNTKATTSGEYRIHPAFIAFDTNGLWVGKFETGYNQNTNPSDITPTSTWSMDGAQINEQESNKVIIKPNVYSWRNINVSNAFYTSYGYKRDLESHMMKNTEWGAVAYLTQSEYGRCTNGTCTEMNMNNGISFITGWSTTKKPTCGLISPNEECNHYGGPTNLNTLSEDKLYSYYKIESQDGSTTGNYMGIYDMAGGSWEYVMGVIQSGENNINPTSGRSKTYNSGFNGIYSCPTCDNKEETETELTKGLEWPSSKYYDLYDYKKSNQQYQRGILGDATKELGPFYSVQYQKQDSSYGSERYVSSYNADLARFANFDGPWFARGGSRHDGTDAGVFAFFNYYGHASSDSSFRIVLTP